MANKAKQSDANSTNNKSFMQRFKEYYRQLQNKVREYTSISQVESNDELAIYVALHPDAWEKLRLVSSSQDADDIHRAEEAEQDD
jgi:hypothetical protein